MPGDYTKQIATALRLIKAKGALVDLVRPNNAVNPVTQEVTLGNITQEVSAVRLPLSLSTKDVTVPEHLRTSVLAKFLVAAAGLSIVPQVNDQITTPTATWTIFCATQLAPAETPIIYTLYASK